MLSDVPVRCRFLCHFIQEKQSCDNQNMSHDYSNAANENGQALADNGQTEQNHDKILPSGPASLPDALPNDGSGKNCGIAYKHKDIGITAEHQEQAGDRIAGHTGPEPCRRQYSALHFFNH